MKKTYCLRRIMILWLFVFTSQAQTVSPVVFSATAKEGARPNSYLWNFGGGNSESDTTPRHNFLLNGTDVAYVEAFEMVGDFVTFCDTGFMTSLAYCHTRFTETSSGLSAIFAHRVVDVHLIDYLKVLSLLR